MNYQLLALDLDGTLTNSRKEITPSTRDALIDIQKNGKKVVLASGRPSPVRSFTANIFQMMLRLRFLKS